MYHGQVIRFDMKQNSIYMKKHFYFYCLLALLVCTFTGCTSSKSILYFQDIDKVQLGKLPENYEAVIKKDDRLVILVTGPDKSVIAPYNLTMSENLSGSTNIESSNLSYLVDKEGNIDFPVLGKLHVEGLTRMQLTNYLKKEISRDVKDPIVTITFKNFRFTVLGEIGAPGTYNIESDKTSILQAIGMAGDLKLTAKRDDIILLREVDGALTYTKLNLKDCEVLDSPYYYLQQNDVLYIQPSASRVATGTSAPALWSYALGTVASLLALAGLLWK